MSVQESLAEARVGGGLLAGLGALSAAVCAWDLLKEVTAIFITSTLVWPQVRQQGGNTDLLINRILELVVMPSSRGLPGPGIEPGSSALQVDSFIS